MRSTVSALAALALIFSRTAPARAEEAWPRKKPIALIVPFAPGGASDFVARIIGPPLSAELKQSVSIKVRAGALPDESDGLARVVQHVTHRDCIVTPRHRDLPPLPTPHPGSTY